jgi:glycosyltransferase involved in cell wall biosynthesis
LKVSILVPAFNEDSTLECVVLKLVALSLPEYEIIVVDDGSTDQTVSVAKGLMERFPQIKLYCQAKNQGKTAAIARAIRESDGDILIVQDADLEYDPAEIPDVIAPILDGVADVVYGSRFLVKRASRVLYYYHYLANQFLTCLSNILTNRNMSDIETCYKAFRREVIAPMHLCSRGFGMEVEITAMVCKTRAKTYEVPISYYGRTYEEGKKIGTMDGVAAIWYILYFNLIHPFTTAGRAYVKLVNQSLASLAGKTKNPGPEGVPTSQEGLNA